MEVFWIVLVGFHGVEGATLAEGHWAGIKLVNRFYSQSFLPRPL